MNVDFEMVWKLALEDLPAIEVLLDQVLKDLNNFFVSPGFHYLEIKHRPNT